MQPRYHITSTGIRHVTASPVTEQSTDDSQQRLLLFILKQSIKGPVLFSEILQYFNDNKSLAFKKISNLISLQLIDMTESETVDNGFENRNSLLSALCTNNDYILANLNGLPISFCGFEQQQAVNISAAACDYIKASRRSRYESKTSSLDTPLSIQTSWNNIDITIYLLHLENFSCLLISKEPDFINHIEFLKIASYLCNRYSHNEQNI